MGVAETSPDRAMQVAIRRTKVIALDISDTLLLIQDLCHGSTTFFRSMDRRPRKQHPKSESQAAARRSSATPQRALSVCGHRWSSQNKRTGAGVGLLRLIFDTFVGLCHGFADLSVSFPYY
jgi:hypothetical protein